MVWQINTYNQEDSHKSMRLFVLYILHGRTPLISWCHGSKYNKQITWALVGSRLRDTIIDIKVSNIFWLNPSTY